MKDARDLLILDDDPGIVAILANFAKANGFTYETAGSIDEARHKLDQFQFLAILSDMRMPLATGTQFLETIRSLDIQTPVVFLSAVSEPERVIEAMGFGAFDYIFKPFKREELLPVLKKAMDAGRKVIDDKDQAS
jgi:two-component system response regulator AtoC